jgi:hypothetical protein
MYGLPVDFDASVFVGRTVELVSFAFSQVDLSFDGIVLLSIQSAYLHDHGQESPAITAVPSATSTLMQLVEQVVTDASGDDTGTLTLRFANGHVLQCLDNSPAYECYSIQHAGGRVIV